METEGNASYTDQVDWYVMTELAGDMINEVMAFTAREEMIERQKKCPDFNRIEKLHALLKGVREVASDPDNFQSLEKVDAIIRRYNEVLESEQY